MSDIERPQVIVQEIVERKLFLRPQNPSHIGVPLPAGELAREPNGETDTR